MKKRRGKKKTLIIKRPIHRYNSASLYHSVSVHPSSVSRSLVGRHRSKGRACQCYYFSKFIRLWFFSARTPVERKTYHHPICCWSSAGDDLGNPNKPLRMGNTYRNQPSLLFWNVQYRKLHFSIKVVIASFGHYVWYITYTIDRRQIHN